MSHARHNASASHSSLPLCFKSQNLLKGAEELVSLALIEYEILLCSVTKPVLVNQVSFLIMHVGSFFCFS